MSVTKMPGGTMKINATEMFTVLVKLGDEDEEEIELICKYHMPENLAEYAPEIAAQLHAIANELFNPNGFN